jgi:hypothetical protein
LPLPLISSETGGAVGSRRGRKSLVNEGIQRILTDFIMLSRALAALVVRSGLESIFFIFDKKLLISSCV